MSTEAVGVVLALAKVFGLLPFDLLGVAGILVAAVTSWMQLNQYSALSQIYGLTAASLLHAHARTTITDSSWTETTWASFVVEVENILTAEHAQWRSLRGAEEAEGGPLT